MLRARWAAWTSVIPRPQSFRVGAYRKLNENDGAKKSSDNSPLDPTLTRFKLDEEPSKNPRANVSSGRPPAGRHCPWEPTALHVAVTVTAFAKHKNKPDARNNHRREFRRESRLRPETHDSTEK
jgi:hypothetical protein